MTHFIEGPKARFQPKQVGMVQTTLTYVPTSQSWRQVCMA